jgi:hypothetical protein
MKSNKRIAKYANRSRRGCRYPNAAEPQYYLHKAAELVLTIVTGTGLAAVFAWMIVL